MRKLKIWELVACLMSLRDASDKYGVKYNQRDSKQTPNSPKPRSESKNKEF